MKHDKDAVREVGELSVIGLTLVIATVIGYYLGTQIDSLWPGFAPWGTVFGLIVGLAAGFLEMFKMIRRASVRLDDRSRGDTNSDERQSHET